MFRNRYELARMNRNVKYIIPLQFYNVAKNNCPIMCVTLPPSQPIHPLCFNGLCNLQRYNFIQICNIHNCVFMTLIISRKFTHKLSWTWQTLHSGLCTGGCHNIEDFKCLFTIWTFIQCTKKLCCFRIIKRYHNIYSNIKDIMI